MSYVVKASTTQITLIQILCIQLVPDLYNNYQVAVKQNILVIMASYRE